MKFWATKSFKELQQSWYDKLRAEGFVDAEELIGNEMVLRQSDDRYTSPDELSRFSKRQYFSFLSEMVGISAFDNEIDAVIMAMRADGTPIKLISETTGRHRFTVRTRIRTYEMRWGLRYYTKKQLNKVS